MPTNITNSEMTGSLHRRMVSMLVTAVVVLGGAVVGVVPASAHTDAAVLNASQFVYPSHLAPGGTGHINVSVENIGNAATVGTLSAHVTLPVGVTASGDSGGLLWSCPGATGTRSFTCTPLFGNVVDYGPEVLPHTSVPYLLSIGVQVDPAANGALGDSVVSVTDSATAADTSRTPVVVSDQPVGFGIAAFEGWGVTPQGTSATQAGGHPDVTTNIQLTTTYNADDGLVEPVGNMKDISVDLPPGLIGNPTAMKTCSPADVADRKWSQCSPESQVGTIDLYLNNGNSVPGVAQGLAVYNIDPPAGVAGRFAFSLNGVVTNIDARVRAGGDYGVTADITGISQSLAVTGSKLTLWGVPADPSHDPLRQDPAKGPGQFGAKSLASPVAFLTTPTSCTGQSLRTTMTANSWENPLDVQSAGFDTDFNGDPIRNLGCDALGFVPQVKTEPTTTQPDTPTGLDVTIDSPQNLDNPDGLANAQLKDAKVTLPEGMTINPGSADGLQACSDQQLGLNNDRPVACPDGAKIGTVTATSPLLKETLSGEVYVRSQASDDPESGQMFRMALVLKNQDRGVLVKLAGAIRVSKDTGRIVTEFDNNPQLPVDHIALHLKGGPRAPLVTPATCGSKAIETNLTSWAGHDVQKSNTFDIACTQGLGAFTPAFTAGTVTPVAGAFSPFTLGITKPDGNADLNGLSMTLPTGLLARLKGNLNTQVGTVKAYAGPGSNPFMLPGKVFLEGRYGDAPFSLRVVVPAKAGPFDLGTVEVRQKVYVDPIDAHVTVVSDPVPTIVKGVPVRLQRLDVSVDKPDFIINPTSCAAKAISGTLSAVGGQTAAVTNRFQVGDCGALDLKPELALSLSGKGQTTDGKHPAITANLIQKPGQANLKKVKVTLPLSMALDPDNANGLCEFADGSKVEPTCPKNSIVGTATATTPILDEALSGPVYFVKNIRKDAKTGRDIKTLPKLVIPLVGQNGVKLTLTGTSNVENDQLVTTFDNIPDASVSGFKLNIIGGKGGILVVSGTDICKSTQIADQQIIGQNTKAANVGVYIQTPSCPTKIISKKITAKSVVFKIGGLGAGKVTVTGRGIKKTTKTITKSTVATITAKRTKGKPGAFKVKFAKAKPKAPVA